MGSLRLNKSSDAIMEKLCEATTLFQPTDSYTESLADVMPSFSMNFECQELDKPAVSLKVEMDSNPTEPGLYENTGAIWSRLGRRENSTPLDVSMIQLHGFVP